MLTAGPERATEAIRKALSMGADKAVHLVDDGLHGSDIVQTGWALARALGTIEGTELVIAGNEATDGAGGAVPAIIAGTAPPVPSVASLPAMTSSVP